MRAEQGTEIKGGRGPETQPYPRDAATVSCCGLLHRLVWLQGQAREDLWARSRKRHIESPATPTPCRACRIVWGVAGAWPPSQGGAVGGPSWTRDAQADGV